MSLSLYTSTCHVVHTRSLSCNFDNNICTCRSKWIASVVESIPLGSGLYTAQPMHGLIAPHIYLCIDEDEKGHCQILNPFVQPSLGDQSGDLRDHLHVRQENLYQHLGKDRVVRRFASLRQQHCRRLRVSLPGA